MRKKDVVLMATVTSFESLPRPSKSQLRQFAELFAPLFLASTPEARRQAVAALSQCPNVPPAVAFFIASQPISIAAPFLVVSRCLDDETLITIARTQGAAHARAIVRREALSPTVIDALVGLRQAKIPENDDGATPPSSTGVAAAASRTTEPATAVSPPPAHAAPSAAETARHEREEALRQQIKQLAHHLNRPENDRLGLRRLTDVQEALLIRFARAREAGHFATTLADSLSASRWLAERILLDISGTQLATTLKGLGMDFADAVFILERFYPHLTTRDGEMSRAERIVDGLQIFECEERVEAWRRADSYTFHAPRHEPLFTEKAKAEPHPAPQRSAAAHTGTVRAFGRAAIRSR